MKARPGELDAYNEFAVVSARGKMDDASVG
jgi:hypothetical protein